MSKAGGRMGPGSVRVAQFIGRLGVVSLPAVGVALDLDERVVRRHVSKLEAAGWLGREAWIWGEGSVAWLTWHGLRASGLGGLQPVKLPPAPMTVDHGVAVGWSAARVERRGRRWQSARELALDPARWSVRMRDERGASHDRLPDLAVWLPGVQLPVAVIAEPGQRREDRQRRILEAWREAVHSGRYAGIRYDCPSASVAQRMRRLAEKVRLTRAEFIATVQMSAQEIAALSRDADDESSAGPPGAIEEAAHVGPGLQAQPIADHAAQSVPVNARELQPRTAPAARASTESIEAAAERQQRLRAASRRRG